MISTLLLPIYTHNIEVANTILPENLPDTNILLPANTLSLAYFEPGAGIGGSAPYTALSLAYFEHEGAYL